VQTVQRHPMLFIRNALETPKRPKVIPISLWHTSSCGNLEGDYETQPQSELYLVFPCFTVSACTVVPCRACPLGTSAQPRQGIFLTHSPILSPPPPPPSSLLLHLTNDHDAFQKLFILDTSIQSYSIHSTQQTDHPYCSLPAKSLKSNTLPKIALWPVLFPIICHCQQ